MDVAIRGQVRILGLARRGEGTGKVGSERARNRVNVNGDAGGAGDAGWMMGDLCDGMGCRMWVTAVQDLAVSGPSVAVPTEWVDGTLAGVEMRCKRFPICAHPWDGIVDPSI